MDPYTAGKIEGMLQGARAHLEAIADDIRQATPEAMRHDRLMKIGRALTELLDLSNEIYAEHPALEPRPAVAPGAAGPRTKPSRGP
jgi:hypothetical protein